MRPAPAGAAVAALAVCLLAPARAAANMQEGTVSGQVAAYYHAVRPDAVPSPDWQLRVQFALLFPK